MKILGIGPSCHHDPSAALFVDGKLIAAAEEERFIRQKHASGKLAINSSKFCLKRAGINPSDLDAVAFAWNPQAYIRGMWKYSWGIYLKNYYQARKVYNKRHNVNAFKAKIVYDTIDALGIDRDKIKVFFIEHHLAHAASAFFLSGFKNSAVMSIDGSGEYITTLFAQGSNLGIKKIKEFYEPRSLGLFYSAMTEFLGFRRDSGEYKLMGMSPYGDASKIDLSHIVKLSCGKREFFVDSTYVKPKMKSRYNPDVLFGSKLVRDFGPPRSNNGLSQPYVNIAAAVQKVLEDVTLGLVDTYLMDVLRKNRRLCFAGGCALNVCLNRKLLEHPLIDELFVQPAAGDSGTALGAAAFVAHQAGERVEKIESVYLGPEFSNAQIEEFLKKEGIPYEKLSDPSKTGAQLLAEGKVIGWFQGQMEFGPRALGNRSILANPAVKGISDKINETVKFREKWRPFCPSILEEYAQDILGTTHPAPFMTTSFIVSQKWRSKIPEVVHVDNSARPQVVTRESNLKFYNLISSLYQETGIPVVLNTSLNRKDEPIVCTPADAVNMFYNCGLDYIIIGDFFITKS